VWVDARGRDDWSLRVKIRSRGRYQVLSRASQRGGVVEGARTARNTRAFRLR
jgi:hypothetical protein